MDQILIFDTHRVSQEAISYAIKLGLMLDTATMYNNEATINKSIHENGKYPMFLTKFALKILKMV